MFSGGDLRAERGSEKPCKGMFSDLFFCCWQGEKTVGTAFEGNVTVGEKPEKRKRRRAFPTAL